MLLMQHRLFMSMLEECTGCFTLDMAQRLGNGIPVFEVLVIYNDIMFNDEKGNKIITTITARINKCFLCAMVLITHLACITLLNLTMIL